MYATLTTTQGQSDDQAALGRVIGEEMFRWLRQIDGFIGIVLLTNQETGQAQVLALWESEDVAERHRAARDRLRERVTGAVDAEVREVVSYDVAFAGFAQDVGRRP